MEVKIELVTFGVKALEEKIIKAQTLLGELNKLIEEINKSEVAITLKPS